MIAPRIWPACVVCLLAAVVMLGRVVPGADVASGPDAASQRPGWPSAATLDQPRTATPVADPGLTRRATPRPAGERSADDDALREAWYSNGCHLNPANGADCLDSGDGEPAVNCLFLFADRDCSGRRGTSRPPVLDCTPFDRDPTCDGFAPHS